MALAKTAAQLYRSAQGPPCLASGQLSGAISKHFSPFFLCCRCSGPFLFLEPCKWALVPRVCVHDSRGQKLRHPSHGFLSFEAFWPLVLCSSSPYASSPSSPAQCCHGGSEHCLPGLLHRGFSTFLRKGAPRAGALLWEELVSRAAASSRPRSYPEGLHTRGAWEQAGEWPCADPQAGFCRGK